MRRTILSLALLFIFSWRVLTHASQPEAVVIAGDEWCPVTCLKDHAKGPGIVPEIVAKALEGSAYKLDYRLIAWARAVEMAKKNEIDGLAGLYTSDAPDFLFPSKPLLKSRDCFYGWGKDSWRFEGFGSLKGKHVGTVKEYSYGEEMDRFKESEAGKKICEEVGGESPLDQNLKKLMSKRIQLVLENELVISFKQSEDSSLSEMQNRGCMSDKEIFMAMNPKSKKGAQVIELVSKFLKSDEGSAFVKQVTQKYVGKKAPLSKTKGH